MSHFDILAHMSSTSKPKNDPKSITIVASSSTQPRLSSPRLSAGHWVPPQPPPPSSRCCPIQRAARPSGSAERGPPRAPRHSALWTPYGEHRKKVENHRKTRVKWSANGMFTVKQRVHTWLIHPLTNLHMGYMVDWPCIFLWKPWPISLVCEFALNFTEMFQLPWLS